MGSDRCIGGPPKRDVLCPVLYLEALRSHLRAEVESFPSKYHVFQAASDASITRCYVYIYIYIYERGVYVL